VKVETGNQKLSRCLFGLETRAFVAAVTERFIFGLTAAAKVEGIYLVFLMFLTLVIE
jgi:hypothetical protein